ncbi:MAG TPA: hypothetical protein VK789_12270 [Bryobacteraceae bacterium]|nr:hypothetical protein [Bryobacteraceae bacterium]
MDCADCDNLLSHYESLTFSVARIENCLEIAERMYDLDAVQRLTAEVRHLAARQKEVRTALVRHRDTAHPFLLAPGLAAG